MTTESEPPLTERALTAFCRGHPRYVAAHHCDVTDEGITALFDHDGLGPILWLSAAEIHDKLGGHVPAGGLQTGLDSLVATESAKYLRTVELVGDHQVKLTRSPFAPAGPTRPRQSRAGRADHGPETVVYTHATAVSGT